MYGRNIGMKMLIQIQNWEYKLYTNTNGRRRVYTNMNVNMNTRIQVYNNINIIIWIYVGWPCWKWFGFWMAWTSILLVKRRILLTGEKRASLQEIWIDKKFLAGCLITQFHNQHKLFHVLPLRLCVAKGSQFTVICN